MLAGLALSALAGILLKVLILGKKNSALKLFAVTATGVILIAFSLQSYLSTKELNIYENLGVGRMIQVKDLLRLIKNNKEYLDYYEDVEKGIYELRCIHQQNSEWITESFTFYGVFLLITNLLSFYNSSISRIVLLLIVGALGCEFLIYTQSITFTILIYTSCEQAQILRCIVPGVALICYLLYNLRIIYKEELVQKCIRNIVDSDPVAIEFEQLMEKHGLTQYYSFTSFINKIIDNEEKINSQPSKLKKVIKILAIGLVIFSLLSNNSKEQSLKF